MIDSLNVFSELNFPRNLQIEEQSPNRPPVTGGEENESSNRLRGEIPGDSRDKVDGSSAGEDGQGAKEGISKNKTEDQTGLTDEEKRKLQELKATDREVRQHEQAHLSAAQGIAISGARYEYERGPDGANYAVGGDVQIDTSKEKDPQQTLEKARKIAAAANAPADPSSQDQKVAAQAQSMEAEARVELAREQREEVKEAAGTGTEPGAVSTTEQGAVSTTEPETVRRAGEASSPSNAENAVGAVNETDLGEREHPGILIYEQNQRFAPESAFVPEFNNSSENSFSSYSTSLSFRHYVQPGDNIDLVA